MLVIHPDECIDCGVCEPECPPEAILPDSEPGAGAWLEVNREMSKSGPTSDSGSIQCQTPRPVRVKRENMKNILPRHQVRAISARCVMRLVDYLLLKVLFFEPNWSMLQLSLRQKSLCSVLRPLRPVLVIGCFRNFVIWLVQKQAMPSRLAGRFHYWMTGTARGRGNHGTEVRNHFCRG